MCNRVLIIQQLFKERTEPAAVLDESYGKRMFLKVSCQLQVLRVGPVDKQDLRRST